MVKTPQEKGDKQNASALPGGNVPSLMPITPLVNSLGQNKTPIYGS